MYAFDYHRPQTLDDAVRALKTAADGKLLAGGQTLIPTLKQRLAQPSDLIDLGGLAEIRGIAADEAGLRIGAMTRHAEVARSPAVLGAIPALARLAEGIGDPQVRNRGTIGGSVANSDPAADYPAAILALNAHITTTKRTLAADDFFLDLFTTALDEDEIVLSLHVPVPKRAAYAKFPNPASRYAIVGVFVADTAFGVRVAVTGAGACAFRMTAMERALARRFDADALSGIIPDATALNDDLHASRDYRAHLVGVMARRAVAACA